MSRVIKFEVNFIEIENSQVVTTFKIWTDNEKNAYHFHWTLHERQHILPDKKGNNSCKTYIFRIRDGIVQMVYYYGLFLTFVSSRTSCRASESADVNAAPEIIFYKNMLNGWYLLISTVKTYFY